MARIRTVKPEMAQDEDLASCSAWAQLLAVRLLNVSDDEGYFKAHTSLIRAACFPLINDDSLSIHGVLTELSNIGYLVLFSGSDTKAYGVVSNFKDHQKINRPTPSKIKDLQKLTESSLSDHGGLTIGKERKGTITPDESGYVFEGETITLNHADYQKFLTLYPNLDLDYNLSQLDLELRGKKKWFVELQSKLCYRNKTPTHQKTTTGRVAAL